MVFVPYWLALDEGVPGLRLRALLHARHVAQADALAPGHADDDRIAERLRRERLSLRLDDDALILRVDEAGAHHAGGRARGIDHVAERKVVRNEALGHHADLQLPHVPAEHAALGDARYGEQPGLQHPVGERPQVHRRERRGDETDLQQVHRGRGERRHLRRPHADRELARGLTEPFREHVAGKEDVRAFLEDHRDDRQTLDRLGADGFLIAEPGDRRLDRPGDELLRLFRGETRTLRLDLDLRLHEVRKDIELRVGGDVDAVGEQQARERDGGASETKGDRDDRTEHLGERPLRGRVAVTPSLAKRPRTAGHSCSPPRPLSSSDRSCCAPATTARSPGRRGSSTNQPFSVGRVSSTRRRSNASSLDCT